MAVEDYIGRRADIAAIRPQASTAAPVGQSLMDGGGEICVGVQKLAQRWIVEFMTDRGSVRYFPDRGSAFLTQFNQGALRTEADVFTAFLLARDEVGANLSGVEEVDDPDDEKYQSAELTNVVIRADRTLVLRVTVTSAAGTSRKVILPISAVPWRP